VNPYLAVVLVPVALVAGLVATVWTLIAHVDALTSLERAQLTFRAVVLFALAIGTTVWLVHTVRENCDYGSFSDFVECLELFHL